MSNECKILRIIDANFNRATEGIRVAEEISRFILEDKRRTFELKSLRGELAASVGQLAGRVKARDSRSDIGRTMESRTEGKRNTLLDLFGSNIKRAEEAVRVLEEFLKLENLAASRKCKQIRFKLYQIEKELTPKVVKLDKLDFDVYVVTDPAFDHLRTAHKVLRAGVKMIQLRDKKLKKLAYRKIAKQFALLAKKHSAAFIVNDHWEMVRGLGADGVHLGQEDLNNVSLAKVRREIGEDKIIGLSTHSLDQAIKGERLGADYISVGPIFRTPSKPGVKPVGLPLLKKVLERVKIPVVAIGGIDANNYKKILKSGCRRFAVIRAVREISRLRG